MDLTKKEKSSLGDSFPPPSREDSAETKAGLHLRPAVSKSSPAASEQAVWGLKRNPPQVKLDAAEPRVSRKNCPERSFQCAQWKPCDDDRKESHTELNPQRGAFRLGARPGRDKGHRGQLCTYIRRLPDVLHFWSHNLKDLEVGRDAEGAQKVLRLGSAWLIYSSMANLQQRQPTAASSRRERVQSRAA